MGTTEAEVRAPGRDVTMPTITPEQLKERMTTAEVEAAIGFKVPAKWLCIITATGFLSKEPDGTWVHYESKALLHNPESSPSLSNPTERPA